jgi:hypothetical protein
MTEILDLDAVVAQDIVVVLGGEEYRIPGDPPMEIYVQLLDLEQRGDEIAAKDEAGADDAREFLDSVLEPVYELFAIRQPELERDTLRRKIGIAQIGAVVARVMEIYVRRGVGPPAARPTRATSRSKKSSRRSA